jgi:hypothetical protein
MWEPLSEEPEPGMPLFGEAPTSLQSSDTLGQTTLAPLVRDQVHKSVKFLFSLAPVRERGSQRVRGLDRKQLPFCRYEVARYD